MLNKYKYYRLRAGLTQMQLAKRLGVKQPTVAQWEAGKANPTAKLLPLVAKVLKVKIDALLTL